MNDLPVYRSLFSKEPGTVVNLTETAEATDSTPADSVSQD